MFNFFRQLLLTDLPSGRVSIALLLFRLGIGGSMIHTHGMKKLLNFQESLGHIPDPFGVGAYPSMVIALLGNLLFAAFVMVGFMTRISALFICSITLVGLLVVHAADPWTIKDVPYMYTLAFGLIFILGPGRYSLDHQLT